MALNRLKRALISEWAAVILLLALAAFFRFYRLNAIPPGLHYDEAGEGLDALSMLTGGFRLFSTAQGGREPLFAWLMAAVFWLWGPQAILLRAMGALSGVLAVGWAYLLTRTLFLPLMPRRARWLATLTALGLAVSYWQIHLTRIGLRHVLLPGIISLGFYFLWRGFRSQKQLHFLLTGVILGAGLYTYLSARFIPIFLGLFLLLEGLMRAAEGRPAEALWRRHRQNLLLTVVTAGLVFAPLAAYFLARDPGEFLGRANQVSIFNPALNQGHLWRALADSAMRNFGAVAFFGDADALVNLPGRPMFDPLMAAAFALGLAVTLRRIRRPAYLFVALWWPVMLLPAALTYDRTPRFMRAMGVAPGLYIFPALGLLCLGQWLWRQRARWAKPAAVILPLAALALSGGLTFHDYFGVWGTSPAAAEAFYAAYTDLAHKMVAEGRPDELWLYPTDLRINYPRRHRYILRFIGYNRLPPEKFLSVDELDMFSELSRQTEGIRRMVLVNMKTGLQQEADAKHVLPFLLEKYGAPEKTLRADDFDLTYYRLDESPVEFTRAQTWRAQNIGYGPGLQLQAAAYGDASGANPPDATKIPSGETIWVALHWLPAGPQPKDYQASARLLDEAGRVLSQVDNPLSSRWHIPPTGWHPQEDIFDYYLLKIPAGTLPGPYRLEVALYAPDTLQPLPAATQTGTRSAATLGIITVLPAVSPASPADVPVGVPLNAPWQPGLTLIGADPPPDTPLRPGDTLSLALVWRSSASSLPPAGLDVVLQGDAGDAPLLLNTPVGGPAFPTTVWRAGETVRQWLDAPLPPNLPAGTYTLALGHGQTVVAIGPVTVSGRPRIFSLPDNLAYALQTDIGPRIRLAGLNVSPSAGQLDLTLYWQTLASMDTSYTVFVHILNEAGEIAAQRDQLPQGGEAPTTGWLAGEIIADGYAFNLPPGNYRLTVGLYNAATGQRLPIAGTPDNRLVLPQVFTVTP